MGTSGLVTILFTDLVGSTAHASTVGDPAADEMRRDHFASLREAVVATGGTEVKPIGDALMVSYPGAANALTGAATMQRAVERHKRRLADGQVVAMRMAYRLQPPRDAAEFVYGALIPFAELFNWTGGTIGEDVGMTGPFGTVVKGRELLAALDAG